MKSSVVVLSALAAHSVSAGWFDQKPKTCVQSTPQQCTPQELNGLDWSDLSVGPVQKSLDYAFQGFTCQESSSKKCITTDIQVEKFTNEISSTKQFSITNLHVSVDKEVDVEFEYSMPDGSVCRQIQSCSTSTTVTNTQCGGAISVKSRIFKKNSNTVDKCSLSIHKIDFNCGQQTESTSPAPVNSTAAAPVEDDDQPAIPASQSTSDSSSNTLSGQSIPTPSSKPTDDNTDSSTDDAEPSQEKEEKEETVSTAEKRDDYEDSTEDQSTGAVQNPQQSHDAPAYDAPAYDAPAPSSALIPASISASIPTSMPAPEPYPVSAPTVSPPAAYSAVASANSNGPVVSLTSVITVTSTSCTKGEASVPSTPAESVKYPEILPQCMQTYVKLTKCVNNGDVNCLCPNPEYTKQVTDCIAAWGNNTNGDIPQAIEYLQGLCAAYITKNPNIVVDVPAYITLPPATGPVTTVSVSSTMVIPDTAAYTKSVVHIQSFVTKFVMTAVTVPAVKIIPSGPSDAVVVPATVAVPALTYPSSPAGPSDAPVVPGYGNVVPPVPYSTGGVRPFNTTSRPYNATSFNTTNYMPPPSFGAADNLSPVRYVVVLVAGLVSFVLLA